MIAEAFAYAIAVTLLVGLAAASVERVLAELGRPRRVAWLGAYAVALVLPPVALLTVDAPAADAVLSISVASAAALSAIDWDTVLILLWGTATAVLLIGYLAVWIRLALLARRWPRIANDHAAIVLADNVGPAVLGVFKPRIVLPRWLAAAPEDVRSTVVAHELEHIAVRDQVLIVAAQIVTVLLPWNLPLWWFARRLRTAIELDCDVRVLRRGVDATHYADVLLAVGQRRSFSPYVAATLIEPVTQLERRIRIMLTRRKPGAALRAAAAGTLAMAIAACVTRIEPPVVIANSEPAVVAGEERVTSGVEPVVSERSPRILISRSSSPARLVRDSTGIFTITASQVVLSEVDRSQMRVTSSRVTLNPENLVFEGNVKIELDGTSITAARAVATETAGGRVTLTVDDVVVTRQAENAGSEDEP